MRVYVALQAEVCKEIAPRMLALQYAPGQMKSITFPHNPHYLKPLAGDISHTFEVDPAEVKGSDLCVRFAYKTEMFKFGRLTAFIVNP